MLRKQMQNRKMAVAAQANRGPLFYGENNHVDRWPGNDNVLPDDFNFNRQSKAAEAMWNGGLNRR